MKSTERKLQILNQLSENKEMSVEELSKIFHISESTVRRELTDMERQGLIIRTYGGACIKTMHKGEMVDHNKRRNHNYSEKIQIAKMAAQYIEDDDSVFLHSSSITDIIPDFLNSKNVTIATNSLNVAYKLKDNDEVQLIVLGGNYFKYAEAVEGHIMIRQLEQMHFNKVFFGANGVDQKYGVTTLTEFEKNSKVVSMQIADESYLLCEHQKFDRSSLFKIVDLKDLDHIITDNQMDQEQFNIYNRLTDIIRAGRNGVAEND